MGGGDEANSKPSKKKKVQCCENQDEFIEIGQIIPQGLEVVTDICVSDDEGFEDLNLMKRRKLSDEQDDAKLLLSKIDPIVENPELKDFVPLPQ